MQYIGQKLEDEKISAMQRSLDIRPRYKHDKEIMDSIIREKILEQNRIDTDFRQEISEKYEVKNSVNREDSKQPSGFLNKNTGLLQEEKRATAIEAVYGEEDESGEENQDNILFSMLSVIDAVSCKMK